METTQITHGSYHLSRPPLFSVPYVCSLLLEYLPPYVPCPKSKRYDTNLLSFCA